VALLGSEQAVKDYVAGKHEGHPSPAATDKQDTEKLNLKAPPKQHRLF
jgi:hypothetical protein